MQISLDMIRLLIMEEIRTFHNADAFRCEPALAVADAHDPLFKELKNIVSPSHFLPDDLVSDAKSVITYFVPFSKKVAESNVPGRESSCQWDITSIEAVELIENINQKIGNFLEEHGYQSFGISPGYDYDPKELYSNWSLKSASYIAGLGTFGIHHILITEEGCCGSLGNIITDLKITPTSRPEKEYCLYKTNGSCKKCVHICANQTFMQNENNTFSYNNQKCNEQIYRIVREYPQGPGDFCGKCVCGIPCSFQIPQQDKNEN